MEIERNEAVSLEQVPSKVSLMQRVWLTNQIPKSGMVEGVGVKMESSKINVQ